MTRRITAFQPIKTYEEYWNDLAATIRKGRSRKGGALYSINGRSKLLENNTYGWMSDESTIHIRFHSTDVVTLHDFGAMELTHGGWDTRSTADRMDTYTWGCRVVWRKSGLYVQPYWEAGPLMFERGVVNLMVPGAARSEAA